MSEERSLQHYLALVRRNIWLVLATMLIVGATTVGASLVQDERYRATSKVLYSGSLASPLIGAEDPKRVLDTLVALASTNEVLGASVPVAGYTDVEALRDNLRVGSDTNTDIISLSVSAPTANGAAAAANAVADSFLSWWSSQRRAVIEARVNLLEQQLAALEALDTPTENRAVADLRAQLLQAEAELAAPVSDLALVERAVSPEDAFSPKPVRNGLIGFLSGLVLGLILATARSRLDRRLHTVEEIEEIYGCPPLGVVPYVSSAARGDRRAGLGDFSGSSAIAEAYRNIRTNLSLFRIDEESPRVIVVSSALPDEGKSAASANLAVALASAGQSVLAISADVHSPSLHKYFEVRNGDQQRRPRSPGATARPGEPYGMVDVLAGEIPLEEAARSVSSNGAGLRGKGALALLANDRRFYDPAVLYQSGAMRQLLAEARERYDVVVIDAPPLLARGEASVLAQLSDALLLVTRMNLLTRDGASRAKRLMDAAHISALGLIVTGRLDEEDDSYYAYTYRYGAAGHS